MDRVQAISETSNAPSRRGVQPTVEISRRSENAELNICKDEVENREGSDKPTPSGRIIRPKKPDYPTREIKRRRSNSDRVQSSVEENQV